METETGRPEDARHVAFLRENSSGLLRASDGTRRLVRMHRAYHEYREAVKQIPVHERTSCEAVQWPESSDAVCWYCRRGFSNVPLKIPRCRNLDGSLTVYGNFCCFACMSAYMWRRRSLTTPEQLAIVTQLARQCGIEGRLPMAPDLEDLEESGGDMTWEEFDRFCHLNTVRHVTRLPPMVEAMVGIEETYDAIKSGGAGMETIMNDVFGVPMDATDKAQKLALKYEQTIAEQEQMYCARRNPKTPAQALATASGVSMSRGAQKRRLVAMMNEPSTIDLDNLQPPSQDEIKLRLDNAKQSEGVVVPNELQPSLFEQYVKERRGSRPEEATSSAGQEEHKSREDSSLPEHQNTDAEAGPRTQEEGEDCDDTEDKEKERERPRASKRSRASKKDDKSSSRRKRRRANVTETSKEDKKENSGAEDAADTEVVEETRKPKRKSTRKSRKTSGK